MPHFNANKEIYKNKNTEPIKNYMILNIILI